MLSEFLDRQRAVPEAQTLLLTDQDRFISETVQSFNRTVDFLRGTNFPNAEINSLITLMWRLVRNKQVPTVLDPDGTIPTFSFLPRARRDHPEDAEGMFIIPLNFIDQVRQDPLMQLGAVVHMASRARDFYTGRIKAGSVDSHIQDRSLAFEAEALLTAQRMAQAEGKQLSLNSYQQDVLSRFPNGLASLAMGVNYETPEWQMPQVMKEQAVVSAEIAPQILKEARGRFDRAVTRIKDSKVAGISEMAERLEARMSQGELPVVYERGADRPMVTEVRLQNVGSEERPEYVPTIVINVAKILGGSMKLGKVQDALAGDLVRTLSIAETVPLNGYQNRKQSVYAAAIETESRWLTETHTVNLAMNDPRITPVEEMLLNLLGDSEYYTDTGWEDFKAALEAYKQEPGITDREIEDIDILLQNPGHFVATRERFTSMMYQVAISQMGEEYKQLSVARRAETSAYNLLGMSLYARDNSSMN